MSADPARTAARKKRRLSPERPSTVKKSRRWLRLALEQLEPRHLLAGDVDGSIEFDISVDRTPPPITWFETFDSVSRIAPESLTEIDPSYPDGFIGPRELAQGEWIVQLSGAVSGQIRELAKADRYLDDGLNNFTVIAGLGSEGWLLVRGEGTTAQDIRSSLRHNPSVKSFSLNSVVTGQATVPSEPDFNAGLLGGLTAIGAESAWDASIGSMHTVVGVVDSGIDLDHPDLYLNIWLNQGEIPASMLDGSGTDLVDIDHDGLLTFYDLNNVTVSTESPHTLTFGGWEAGPNASLVKDENANGYIDANDLLADTDWSNGRDEDGNGFFDDLFGVNFRAGSGDSLPPNDPDDTLGHGTHVAGTIGAVGNNGQGVVGVNWRTSLMSLRILDDNNQGDTGAALRAVNYANQMRSQLTYSPEGRVSKGAMVRVLNNSWGQPAGYETSLELAIQDSADQQILFVAASGNGNILGQGVDNDRTPFYPASYDSPNLIAVAASTVEDKLASFSNFGAESVDIAAPGVAVRSTLPGGSYGSANGTSMASPHVAGTAALIWSATPEATLDEVKEAILSTSVPMASGSEGLSTGGRVDAAAAMSSDVFAPAGRLVTADSVTEPGGDSTEFVVEYRHRLGIDPTSLGDDDVMVTRTWGPPVQVPVSLKPGSVVVGAEFVTATYTVSAPGGAWDALDYGRYQIQTNSGAVSTLGGQLTETRDIGSFLVRVEDASVLYVDRLNDSTGDGSLRDAINQANASAQPRTIILESGRYTIDIAADPDPTATFFLPPAFCASNDFADDDWSRADSGDFDITGDITIAGDSMDETIIDAQGLDRVFKVHPGGSLELNRVTVTGGISPETQGGGGILSAGTLTLNDTIVRENQTAGGGETDPLRGGGVAVWNGTADFYRSWIFGNEADFGGGVFYCDAASGEVSQSTFESNRGGGLHSHSDNLVQVVNSTFSGNSGGKGAIYNGKQDDSASLSGLHLENISLDDSGRFLTFTRDRDSYEFPQTVGVLDQVTGYAEFISTTPDKRFPDGDSFHPEISGSGRYVVYESDATDLVAGDINQVRDVFLFDRETNLTELISRASNGIVGNDTSSQATVSLDGRFVAFVSASSNLVPDDTNGMADIFVRDRVTGVTERVSIASDGTQSDGDSTHPSISDDGRFVAFSSVAGNLDPGDQNKRHDVFVYDRQLARLSRVDVGDAESNAGSDETRPMISGDGSTIVFQTLAEDLLPVEQRVERSGGAAAIFDGIDDSIVVPDSPLLRAPQFAIELTAQIDSQRIHDGDALLVKSSDTVWSDGYGMYYEAGRVYFFVSGKSNVVSAPVRLDAMNHLVGTYDGNTIRLFVDGGEQASLAHVGPATHSTNNLIIGAGPGGEHYFAGSLDDVAVYDKMLDESVIAEHAGSLPLGRPEPEYYANSYLEPEDNDHFENARDLNDRGFYEDRFSTKGASGEVGEPAQSGALSSIWWTWTAPVDGTVNVSTQATSSYNSTIEDTYLTIATGNSVDTLTVVAQDDDGGRENAASASVPVTQGQRYHFSVDGYQSIQPDGELVLDFEPLNMGLENALDLGSAVNVDTPAYVAGGAYNGFNFYKSVWWRWTAPQDGLVSVSTDESSALVLQAFAGSPDGSDVFPFGLTALVNTESNGINSGFPNTINTPVVQGENYYFQVAGRGTYSSHFDFSLDFFQGSAGQGNDKGNDSFNSAVDLGSVVQVSAEGWNAGYTSETGEPAQSGETHSAWWKWTAPSDGMLVVDTIGSTFDTFLTLAEGNSVDQLTVWHRTTKIRTICPRHVIPICNPTGWSRWSRLERTTGFRLMDLERPRV